jgi:hypothetical protein
MAISRGRICQRASTDISMSDTSCDRRAIIATRLVEAVGWTITGGAPTLGSAAACDIRSWTICRAR